MGLGHHRYNCRFQSFYESDSNEKTPQKEYTTKINGLAQTVCKSMQTVLTLQVKLSNLTSIVLRITVINIFTISSY